MREPKNQMLGTMEPPLCSYVLKGMFPFPITIPSYRDQQEIALLCVSNKSKYFFHYNHKISAQNSQNFESYNRKCTYFRYASFDFLMYFHNSLIPGVTYLFLPHERKQEVTLG